MWVCSFKNWAQVEFKLIVIKGFFLKKIFVLMDWNYLYNSSIYIYIIQFFSFDYISFYMMLCAHNSNKYIDVYTEVKDVQD